jgi:tetratricopeptide (TPR) repeat protein
MTYRNFLYAIWFGWSMAGVCLAQTPAQADYQKAAALYNQGNYEQALIYCQNAEDDDLNFWQAYELDGYCQYYLGKSTEMMEAFNASLKIHPENEQLTAFMAKLAKKNEQPPTNSPVTVQSDVNPSGPDAVLTPPAQTPTPRIVGSKSTDSSKQNGRTSPNGGQNTRVSGGTKTGWVKISTGFATTAMGDFVQNTKLWNSILTQYDDTGSGTTSTVGYQFEGEGGLLMDRFDGLALQVGYEGGEGSQLAETDTYYPSFQDISNHLVTANVKYCRFIPVGHSQLILSVGALYGMVLVGYYEDNPYETINGNLLGTGWGYNLEATIEFPISGGLGLDVTAQYRGLNITNVENAYKDFNANQTGTAVLAVSPQGEMGLTDTQNLGRYGLRAANLDYTGFSLTSSLNLFLF